MYCLSPCCSGIQNELAGVLFFHDLVSAVAIRTSGYDPDSLLEPLRSQTLLAETRPLTWSPSGHRHSLAETLTLTWSPHVTDTP